MTQSLTDIILHIVFSTKDRNPWILPEIEQELYQYICGTSRALNCPVIRINGVSDHTHILSHLDKTIPVCTLIGKLKAHSSKWIKGKSKNYRDFAWQAGYGAFSVSRHVMDGPIQYIERQKEHHKKVTFKDEYLKMLKLANIEYDEKYLWD